jgi:YcxB-like protein
MQITYELNEKDFVEAYSVHRNRRSFMKWAYRIFFWIIVALASVIFISFLVQPNTQAGKDLLRFLALVLFWIILLWALPRWTMRRQYRNQPGAKGPRTLLLDAEGAHWRWNGGSADVVWKNYIRWVEGKHQILFYTSPACFNILPTREVQSAQLTEIREMLKQNIQGAKR